MTLQLRTKREIMSFSGLADGLKSVAKGRVVLSINRNMHKEEERGRGRDNEKEGERKRAEQNQSQFVWGSCWSLLPCSTCASYNGQFKRCCQQAVPLPLPLCLPLPLPLSLPLLLLLPLPLLLLILLFVLRASWPTMGAQIKRKYNNNFINCNWCLINYMGAYVKVPMPLYLCPSTYPPLSLLFLLFSLSLYFSFVNKIS